MVQNIDTNTARSFDKYSVSLKYSKKRGFKNEWSIIHHVHDP